MVGSDTAAADLADEKATLRAEAKATRDAILPEDAAAELAQRFDRGISLPPAATVSGYWPLGSEIDPRPLMARLAANGHHLCLPVVTGAGEPLAFRRWSEGDPLVPAGYGTHEPAPTALLCEPGVLLVPLLAFDRRGCRLGYGGGYYDRTLETARPARRILAVGLAYAAQEVAEVPSGPMDQRLDAIVTEGGIFHI